MKISSSLLFLWGPILARFGRVRLPVVGSLRVFEADRIGNLPGVRETEIFHEETEIRAPNFSNGRPRRTHKYPALGLYDFDNAEVTLNPRVSSVFYKGKMLLPKAAAPGPWKIAYRPVSGGIVYEKDGTVVVRSRAPSKICGRAIYVGSWSPHNWYHWLVDTLPSVYLAQFLPAEFDDFPVLVPETVLENERWMEPLKLVLGGREVQPLPATRYLSVERLVWITSPTSPGPLRQVQDTEPNFSMHGSALARFTRHILDELGFDSPAPERGNRVFLVRGPGAKRPYNENELVEIAAEFGFRPISLAEMSFRESVEALATAEAVIGPHGAGWANAMFAAPCTRALMWTWDSARYDNWFANIGALANLDLSIRFTPGAEGSPYAVPPADFIRWVDEMVSL